MRRLRAAASATALAAALTLAPATGTATAIAATPTCADVVAGDVEVSVVSQGATYPVRVHVPTGDLVGQAPPLVLNLHGSMGTGAGQAALTGMDAVADRHGFVVAYPDGGVAQPVGAAWNVPGVPLVTGAPVPDGSRDDERFLRDVVNALGDELCIDRGRVYATGMSGGGRMASYLACHDADLFAAIAPVGGVRAGRARTEALSEVAARSCRPSRPVPVLAIHGRQDIVNPYAGNTSGSWGYSVPTAMERWAELDGCDTKRTVVRVTQTVRRLTWRGCRRSVQLLLSSTGGHTWPGGGAGVGTVDASIDASELIWRFFNRHSQGGTP